MPGPTDQDKLSEDWGLEEALAGLADGTAGQPDKDSAEWAAMLDAEPPKDDDGADRVLNQDEIDSLLGFEDRKSVV